MVYPRWKKIIWNKQLMSIAGIVFLLIYYFPVASMQLVLHLHTLMCDVLSFKLKNGCFPIIPLNIIQFQQFILIHFKVNVNIVHISHNVHSHM